MLQRGFILIVVMMVSIVFSPQLQFIAKAEKADMDGSVADYLNKEGAKNSDSTKKNDENSKQKNQETLGEDTMPTLENQMTWLDYIKMLLSLAVVIVLIYVVFRFVNKRRNAFGQNRRFENLGGIALGPNRSVQIVKIGERVLVLGVGETITKLQELDSEDEINQLLESEDNLSPSLSQAFIIEKFKKLFDKKDDGTPFQSILKNELSEMTKGRKKVYDQLEKRNEE